MANDKKSGKSAKVEAPVKVPLFESNRITIWSDALKKNVAVSQEQSVQDTLENWDAINYGVGAEVFRDNEVGVKAMMKRQGYYPLMVNGKHPLTDGVFYFQHYSRKPKAPVVAA